MNSTGDRHFPFSSVVGQDEAKLALQLVAIDPRIGGVLLRGEKGSAKTTLARGIADLLAGSASFVNLPLGTTEDRLIGTLDLATMLTSGEAAFTPGLLAKAHRGVLYVDEINLLADHLVDTLLDVAVSGINHVERDGVSHRHEAHFVLIGSMNPEEGELRPQLLDRFGLSVQVAASPDPSQRAEAVRRRLRFDSIGSSESDARGPDTTETDRLREVVSTARPAAIPDELVETASRLALSVGAEGLRADIVLCRAAAAYAGLSGRNITDESDLRRVAPLVLAHRSRRNPFDPPVLPQEVVGDAINEVLAPVSEREPETDPDSDLGPGSAAESDSEHGGDQSSVPMKQGQQRRPLGNVMTSSPIPGAVTGRRSMTESTRGRSIRDVEFSPDTPRPVAVTGSVRHLGARRQQDPAADPAVSDLRQAVRERPSGSLIVLVVDTSGSMGATGRAELATGTALGLLTDAYERRDHVALVTFGGSGAEIVLSPTGSIEVARNRLEALETGGATPLAEGLRMALELTNRRSTSDRTPFVVVISDGRASGSPHALEDAMVAASDFARANVDGLVLDCETSVPRLGLASRLAEVMASPCISASDLDATDVSTAIRKISREMLDAR